MTDPNMISRAEHDTALAAVRSEAAAAAATAKTASDAAIATARTEAVTAERDRIKAITSLEEAKGRGASALHLALTSDMTADAAKAVLSGLAVEAIDRAGASALGLALGDDKKPGAGGEAGSWDAALERRGMKVAK